MPVIAGLTAPTIDELRVILQKNKIDNDQMISMLHSRRFTNECGFFYSHSSFISLKHEDKTKVRMLKYCGTLFKWYLKSDTVMTKKQAIEQRYLWSDK